MAQAAPTRAKIPTENLQPSRSGVTGPAAASTRQGCTARRPTLVSGTGRAATRGEGEDQHVGEPHLSGGPEQLPASRRLADDQRADQQYERGEIRYRDQQHQRNRQPTQEPVLLTHPPRVGQHQWYEQDQLQSGHDVARTDQ